MYVAQSLCIAGQKYIDASKLNQASGNACTIILRKHINCLQGKVYIGHQWFLVGFILGISIIIISTGKMIFG